ncbi:MAG: cell division protein ZapA [Myxococcota bacterium]|jgi:cell division protein ZapA (FtsZ GTPase activity inhibitor)|nr:cell division protein ZapA [Myxococcota bacterium]
MTRTRTEEVTRETVITRSTELTVMGQRLNFKADQDLGHIERVAKFVNRRSDDISAGAAVATTKLSVLVAMNIADDYFNALDEVRQLKAALEEHSKRTLGALDEVAAELSAIKSEAGLE